MGIAAYHWVNLVNDVGGSWSDLFWWLGGRYADVTTSGMFSISLGVHPDTVQWGDGGSLSWLCKEPLV